MFWNCIVLRISETNWIGRGDGKTCVAKYIAKKGRRSQNKHFQRGSEQLEHKLCLSEAKWSSTEVGGASETPTEICSLAGVPCTPLVYCDCADQGAGPKWICRHLAAYVCSRCVRAVVIRCLHCTAGRREKRREETCPFWQAEYTGRQAVQRKECKPANEKRPSKSILIEWANLLDWA